MKNLTDFKGGFTFCEVLICIFLYLLIFAGITSLSFSVLQSSEKEMKVFSSAFYQLKADFYFRQKISNAKISYWEKNPVQIENSKLEILLDKNFSVLKVEPIFSDKKKIIGLEVVYEIPVLKQTNVVRQYFSCTNLLNL